MRTFITRGASLPGAAVAAPTPSEAFTLTADCDSNPSGALGSVTRIAAIAIPALFLLAGCATVIRGTEQEVAVNTNPVGAKVEFSNGQSCKAPCTITAARDQSLLVTISKDNCGTQTATMVPTLGGAGVLLGGLIDYGTGLSTIFNRTR